MTLFFLLACAFVAGAAFAAYRLRGEGSALSALRRIIPFAGGPRPTPPK
jgi:hypothetical protein